ncbi:MAG: bacterio-opsin activator domain-containing protein [Polyangiaceae bacterium]
MGPALLATDDLRIDVHGVAVVDGLTLATEHDRVVVVGAPRALFEAACGVVRPSRGAIRIQGTASSDALDAGVIAGAPVDPPLPPTWTPLAYVAWSARLAGFGRAEAGARAAAAVERMGLRAQATEALGRASLAVKRATSIAAAFATGARVIALEDPSLSLEDDAAAALMTVTARALEGRAWLLFASRAPLASPLVAVAEEAIVLSGSTVADRGPPKALATRGGRYTVDVQGPGEALARAVAARGAVVESVVTEPGSARFVLELPEGGSTRDLFACAVEVGAVVVELRPIARAFA